MYDISSIVEAKNIDEAIAALVADKNAVLISGGSDVLIKIREGRLAGCPLVSIHGIPELRGVSLENDGTIVIGPATTFSALETDPVIKEHLPQLALAAGQVGGPQIRSIGTIGGNVCNGATSADTASTLFSMNAVLVLKGSGGVREIPISEFYAGPGKVRLEHDELLVNILINKSDYDGWGGHYIKFAQRNAMDIATLGVAARVRLDGSKKIIEACRLAFGVAGPTPILALSAGEAVAGKRITPELFDQFSAAALLDVSPRTSWRASKEFRIQLVSELSKRALKQAIINAGGEEDA